MNDCNCVKRLHQHRMWVNRRLIESARGLNEDQLHASHEIGQGTIFKTLCHLYAAEVLWLMAIGGDDQPVVEGDLPDRLPGNQLGDGAVTTLSGLIERWNRSDANWEAYLDGLDDAELERTVYKYSTSSGRDRRFGTRCIDVLLHVCTHAQYTTAQAVNMMRHEGLDPLPDAMLITLARTELDGDTVSS